VWDFAPERFLVHTESGPKFSLSGLQGSWIPFGGGIWTCPGRHFVKQQAIFTLAVLSTTFDIEIGDGGDREMSPRRFGIGVLEPKRKIPYKIQARQTKAKPTSNTGP
jgi:cytochrome P450